MSRTGSSNAPGPALALELERDSQAPSVARAAIAGFCENRAVRSGRLATLLLLVSEVVTNAVIHPKVDPASVIGLSAHIDPEFIRVEVTDQGDGFIPRARDPTQVDGGYGLFLLEKEATRWGVDRHQGTTVWFELAT